VKKTLKPGYLNTIQARARDYSRQVGARLAPFGIEPGPFQDRTLGAPAKINQENDRQKKRRRH